MAGKIVGDSAAKMLGTRYQIKQRLGKQAGRQTLLARDKQTQQLVAIKLLTFSNDFSWDDLKLFEREAETLKSLSHPAIPSYLDYFELNTPSGKGFALVQNYIAAKSLEQHLSNGRTFSEAEVKQLAKAILEILSYLHKQNPPVIHRDIKPSNILLSNRSGNNIGQVYLVDFGSVQTLATQEGKTVTVVGTYGYMPPEQFGGRATPASDLYSLGATLIALLTKAHPADLPQKDMRIEFTNAASISPSFANWLKWMTEPSLERRLNSVQSAIEALEKQKYRDNYSLKIRQNKSVSTVNLLWNSVWRSTILGTVILTSYAALYGTLIAPGLGTIFAAILAGVLGPPLGLVNGILIGFITRLFFFPLTNAKLHRQVVITVSIIISTPVSLAYFYTIKPGFLEEGSYPGYLLWIIGPVVIAGLSMGLSSKQIAQWYERKSQQKLAD
jgi:eukaryotic-like serine/threonine-protein kinase